MPQRASQRKLGKVRYKANQQALQHLTQQSTIRTKDLFYWNSVIWLLYLPWNQQHYAAKMYWCLFSQGMHCCSCKGIALRQASTWMKPLSSVCTHHVLCSVSHPFSIVIKRLSTSGTSGVKKFLCDSLKSMCPLSRLRSRWPSCLNGRRQCLHPRSLALCGRALRVWLHRTSSVDLG
jgi:hypothetical protein